MAKKSEEGLRIQHATITNFKNIDSKVIELNGRTLIVSGKNGKGKSSLLQALTCSFNTKISPIKPVKTGEKFATVEILISGNINDTPTEYTVGMQFNPEDRKGRLWLVDDSGKTVSSGQKSILDTIIGDVSFDITDFMKLAETDTGKVSQAGIQKQIEFMEKLIPEEVLIKINELKLDREEVYNDRTEVNREVTALKGKIATSKFTQEEIDLYSKEKSVEDANTELENAKTVNAKIDQCNEFLDNYTNNITDINNEIKLLQEKKETLEKGKFAVDNFLVKNPNKKDVDALLNNLQNLADFNSKVKEVADLKQTEINLKKKEEESLAKTKRLEDIDVEKDVLFKKANLPVDGLEFNDTGIMYQGLPLHETQLPTSQIIIIGMKIGMALNPNLRLIVIKDGSLLDEDMMKLVIDEATKNGYQVLIEVVSNSSDLSLEFIERD